MLVTSVDRLTYEVRIKTPKEHNRRLSIERTVRTGKGVTL